MTKKQDDFEERVTKGLGAQRSFPLDGLPSQGPLDLLELRAELGHRLKSSGGRPTDPAWSVRRVIPFKKEGWAQLEQLAEHCRDSGQTVSPSQLAALLIERGLKDLKRAKAS
ncbi:MAG: hypothetical protein AAF657_33750 [Acidobacteriota bacterium]